LLVILLTSLYLISNSFTTYRVTLLWSYNDFKLYCSMLKIRATTPCLCVFLHIFIHIAAGKCSGVCRRPHGKCPTSTIWCGALAMARPLLIFIHVFVKHRNIVKSADNFIVTSIFLIDLLSTYPANLLTAKAVLYDKRTRWRPAA